MKLLSNLKENGITDQFEFKSSTDPIVGICISNGKGYGEAVYRGPRGGSYYRYLSRNNTVDKRYITEQQIAYFTQ